VDRGEKKWGEVWWNSMGVLAFYRGLGERRRGVAREFNASVNGSNTNEDGGGGFKRGFKGGKMKARW
jgi:hypothetical protein